MIKLLYPISIIILSVSINSCAQYSKKKNEQNAIAPLIKLHNHTFNKKKQPHLKDKKLVIKQSKNRSHYASKIKTHSQYKSQPKDFWENLLKHSAIKYTGHDSLYLQHAKWFKQHPNYIYQILINAKPFLAYIYNQIENKKLPSELLYLPIIESNYDPYAYSYQSAAGIWQLMNLTAKRFNIEQNWWYDGRRDIIDSTEGALKYLSFLYKEFHHNWLLAIAAYNAGEGTVKKAILKNKMHHKPIDFWSLSLPKQTTQYVPKWLALSNNIKTLLKNTPKDFPVIDQKLSRLDLTNQIDLRLVSQLSRLSLENVYFYNPGFNQWATAPDIKQHLLLPRTNINFFKQAIKHIPKDKLVAWRIYTVERGDNLGSIAEHFNITLKDILKYNQISGTKIYTHQHLILPIASAENTVYEKNMFNARKTPPVTLETIQYVIKSGDSLWNIAKQYHVSVKQICSWNQIKASTPIKPRNTLNIIKKIKHKHNALSRPEVIRRIYYSVKKGESCSLIARKFRLPIKKMYEWNSVCNKNIYPKQKLKIFIDVTKQTI